MCHQGDPRLTKLRKAFGLPMPDGLLPGAGASSAANDFRRHRMLP